MANLASIKAPAMFVMNTAGLDIIKKFEGFYPERYLCPAGRWTQGYGHTKGITRTSPRIDQATADQWLREDVAAAEMAVMRLTAVPLTSNQYSALVSLVFNIGSGNFQSSTLRMRLNRGDYIGASEQFGRWVFARGVKLAGLVARRAQERQLFDTPERDKWQPVAKSLRDASVEIAKQLARL